jgi:hypothetical protein
VRPAAERHRYAFAAHAAGCLALELGGAQVVCRPSGALWLGAARALVVADLHLEKGSSYARRGQMLPPYDTADTLTRLEAEVAILSPRVLVFLGDTLHDAAAEERLGAAAADRLRALAAHRTLVWLAGNHDRAAPRSLPGETATSLKLSGLDLVHEPAGSPVSAEAAGHLHPCAKVRGSSCRPSGPSPAASTFATPPSGPSSVALPWPRSSAQPSTPSPGRRWAGIRGVG